MRKHQEIDKFQNIHPWNKSKDDKKTYAVHILDTLATCLKFNDKNWERIISTADGFWRIPSYEEMCYLKEIFWEENEIVFQIHPKQSEYVNIHPLTLHLWRSKQTVERAERRLLRTIEEACEEAKKHYDGTRKSVLLEINDTKVVALFGGENWPTWDEVCAVKQAYWEAEEAAVQFNVSPEFDLNQEKMILLWDAENMELPPKEIV